MNRPKIKADISFIKILLEQGKEQAERKALKLLKNIKSDEIIPVIFEYLIKFNLGLIVLYDAKWDLPRHLRSLDSTAVRNHYLKELEETLKKIDPLEAAI
ncbi:MAG: hypothetical protein ACFFDI_27205, partial [Promethearchaeota archaeon]